MGLVGFRAPILVDAGLPVAVTGQLLCSDTYTLVVMRPCVRVEARGAVPPLPPVLSPCARVGLRARGASPGDARGADDDYGW